MESLARLAARRPVAITVLALAVALVGWLSWNELPLDLLPDISSPTIVVSVRSGDRPPSEMERLYGEQVEQRLFAVRGIREVSQVARTGRLIASLRFDWDSDMDLALVDVQKAVNGIANDPLVDEVLVRHLDPRQAPVLSLGLVSQEGGPDLAELRRIARRQVAPALEQLPDVAQVRVLGGRELEIRVLVDRYRLEAFDVTLAQIEQRLRAENVDIDAGTLEEGGQVFLVRGLSRFRRPDDVGQVVIQYQSRSTGGPAGPTSRQPIRVRDVAEVIVTDAEIDHLVRVGSGQQEGVVGFESREGVGLQVFKEAGANTVEVSRVVTAALDGLSRDLPNVDVTLVSDEAALVEDALAEVQNAAVIGIGLAILVLAIFLRSPGPTLVVASAVPVSLFAALFLMRFFDFSLNIVTLAGLALGAGMLVDNAIVVVESIHRRFSSGLSALEAVARGTSDVSGAIVASTLTTCVVFLPVLFVQGLAARLVEGIAFSVVASLGASLLVAVLLIPALSRWLLPRRSPAESHDDVVATPTSAEEPLSRPARAVEGLVLRLLPWRWGVVALSLLIAAGSVVLLLGLGSELLPPADPRQFSVRMVGPAGQRVEATSSALGVVEQAVDEVAGEHLEAVMVEAGRLPEDDRLITTELTEENTGRATVRLSALGPSGGQVVSRLAPALEDLDQVELEWEVGSSILAQALGRSGPPIVVEIAGRSLDDLRRAAATVAESLGQHDELWNVRSSFEGGPPELRIELDRAMADGLGVDLETVSRVLESALEGRTVTVLSTGDEERDVVIRLPTPQRDELASLRFVAPDGAKLVLGQVARFVEAEGAREVFRRDQRRVARVTARIAEGADYPSAIEATRQALEDVAVAPGLRVSLGGDEEERAATLSELRWAGGLAIVLVLMVLAGTFESLLQPLTVLYAVPLALIGVATTLVPQGHPVGIMAVLGLIVLAGVAVNDAVLLLVTARRLMRDGLDVTAALARAAAVRLRPIVMTTLTTVLALLPLAIGGGEAAQLRSPMAYTIIGGIVTSTLGSLLVLPCLYAVLDGFSLRSRSST